MEFIDLDEQKAASPATVAIPNAAQFAHRAPVNANSARRAQRVVIADLHPTQFTVGYREVERKRQQLRCADLAERANLLKKRQIPVVTGPSKKFYPADRYHWLRALAAEGVQTVEATVIANLHGFEAPAFWRVMEGRGWCHPYHATGARRSAAEIPAAITKLQDDPLRSLASSLRRAEGIPKEALPFSEFRLANYMRRSIPTEFVRKEYFRELEAAI